MNSIRRQLLRVLMVALLGVTIVVGIITYLGAQDEVNELFDSQLRQLAFTIEAQETGIIGERQPNGEPSKNLRNYVKGEKEFLVQIWEKNGALSYTSHAVAFPRIEKRGFHSIDYLGEEWRSFSLPRANDIVQVSQPLKGRQTIIGEIAFRMAIPALLQFPVLAFFGWLAVRRGLHPLKSVSAEISSRHPFSLEAIDITQLPEEIRPLGDAINGLLARLDAALTAHRQFTADAAHELRTPLSAVKLQMELLLRAGDGDEREQAMRQLGEGVERSIRLVQQLLVFARVEPEAKDVLAPVLLSGVVAGAVSQFSLLAAERHIDFGVARTAPLVVQGDAEKLQILLNNLVDNALRYTPQGGSVTISVYADDGRPVLEVADTGLGIPESERERVFDRFYRIAGTKTQGTGLGLAIVRKIADRHGARVALGDGPAKKGLSVRVIFPQTA